MRGWIRAAALAALAGAALWMALRRAGNAPEFADPARFSFLAMGTVGEIAVAGVPDDVARAAADAATARIEALEEAYSAFRTNSLVSRLNRGERVRIPADGLPLFHLALRAADLSGGAFDPTVGPLLKAWGLRGGGAPAAPPGRDALSNALARVGWRRLHLEDAPSGDGAWALCDDGTELDFGGIAKGFAVDRAAEDALAVLEAAGFPGAGLLVNLGGNLRGFGRPRPESAGWTVAIRDPFLPYGRGDVGTLVLTGGLATATSGSYERFVEIDGVRFSHIVDPRSGHPVRGVAQATAVARTAAEADALSTACFILGLQAPETLLGGFPGAEVRLVGEDGTRAVLRAPDGP